MKRYAQNLNDLKNKNRYRALQKPQGIDLSSNDYLGMRGHPALRQTAIEALENGMDLGAGGSRLLRGHTEHHENLEIFAANHFGSQRALFFANGYQANLSLFTALPQRGDVILFDELIHASARDGIQASLAAHHKIRHNDVQSFEDALQETQQKRRPGSMIWIAVESVYSMDGDLAPLKDLSALAQQYDAFLIVDEAHATGVFGEGGRGLAHSILQHPPHLTSPPWGEELDRGSLQALPPPGGGLGGGGNHQPNIITLHTCGKALGVAGGLICASTEIIDTLINTARPFIYSTAPPPLQALLVQKSLEILSGEEGNAKRSALYKLLDYVKLQSFLEPSFEPFIKRGHIKLMCPQIESQIIPIILGDEARALQAAAALQNAGFDIRAIRPPTVPAGTARLRLSLNVNLTPEILERFCINLHNYNNKGRDRPVQSINKV